MKSKDIEVKSHMSILEENQEKLGKSSLKNTAEQNKEAEKKEKPVEEKRREETKEEIKYYSGIPSSECHDPGGKEFPQRR